MKITLPPTRPYGVLFIVGNRLSGAQLQEIGSVIVKAGFRLVPAGSGETHVMADDTDTAASQMVLSDQGTFGAGAADVVREADIAPSKPLSDIAVEGFRGDLGARAAQVRVDGTSWFSRAAQVAPDADSNRHLFGYQPRNMSPRKNEAGSPFPPGAVTDPSHPLYQTVQPPATLPAVAGYDNRVLNFHRRSPGFSVSAAVSGALGRGRRVTVTKGNDQVLSVVLGQKALTVELRAYCGTGPDELPYWSRIRLGAMRADTLILKPDQGRAEVMWRTVWDWRAHPRTDYRAIDIFEGVI